jgi:hypothetical protein
MPGPQYRSSEKKGTKRVASTKRAKRGRREGARATKRASRPRERYVKGKGRSQNTKDMKKTREAVALEAAGLSE